MLIKTHISNFDHIKLLYSSKGFLQKRKISVLIPLALLVNISKAQSLLGRIAV